MADEQFHLVSNYAPTGDQPQAIEQLVEGVERGDRCQTLLGVTGSGKTFTMANVIAQTVWIAISVEILECSCVREFQHRLP